MKLLLAPLRPLADVVDVAAEAALAVGTLSVELLGRARPAPRSRAVRPAY